MPAVTFRPDLSISNSPVFPEANWKPPSGVLVKLLLARTADCGIATPMKVTLLMTVVPGQMFETEITRVWFEASGCAQTTNFSVTGRCVWRPDPDEANRPKKAKNPTKNTAMAMYPVLPELPSTVYGALNLL